MFICSPLTNLNPLMGLNYDICDLWPHIQMVLLIVRPWEQDMSQQITMAQHTSHRWSYVILGAIRPLSNSSHNYPYSCGYMLSIVLYTISMVLYVVNVHVYTCCMKELVTSKFRMSAQCGGLSPIMTSGGQSVSWGARRCHKQIRIFDHDLTVRIRRSRYSCPNIY